jgi:hypothetical protein
LAVGVLCCFKREDFVSVGRLWSNYAQESDIQDVFGVAAKEPFCDEQFE